MNARAARMAIATTVLGATICPAAAGAATVSTDRACYAADTTQQVRVSGSGFDAGAPLLVLLNGGIISTATADAAGSVDLALPVPAPPEEGTGANESGHTLQLSQGAIAAETTFRAARVRGDFTPGSGDPARLRVRFSAIGFGVGTPAGSAAPVVYVHYVDPRKRVRRTVALGAGAGACGTITRTAKRKLFPFRPRSGRWTLQFDTNRAYRRGTSSSPFLWDRLTLTIS